MEGTNEKETQETADVEKEAYLGSVLFFKHVILLAVFLLIFIPTVLAIVLAVRYHGLKTDYRELESIYAQQTEGQETEGESDIAIPVNRNIETAYYTECFLTDGETEDALMIPFRVDLDAWNYLLINDTHPLQQSFVPLLADTRNGKQVDKRIRAQLEHMLDDAQEAGFDLLICSAYRDYEKQQELVSTSIQNFVDRGMSYHDAFYKTKEEIALTGVSEHHTGLAVDIVGYNHQSLDSEQGETPEAKWLEEHAHEYGFILRYPQGKEDITGISYESWHFRYVGKLAADFITENDLCLEEFIKLAEKQNADSMADKLES